MRRRREKTIFDRLKSKIWVQAQVRICDRECIPVVISHKGDADAGAILLKIGCPDKGYHVFTQTRTVAGSLGWMRGTGDAPVSDGDADSYIHRQRNFDPDIWVMEIDDPDGRYVFDGEII